MANVSPFSCPGRFLAKTHGLLRGALREPAGGRKPVVYLVALGELCCGLVEALLELDALPGPGGPDRSGDSADALEDVLGLVVGLCERYPPFCDRFFGHDPVDHRSTALGHLVLRVGEFARHDDLGRAP